MIASGSMSTRPGEAHVAETGWWGCVVATRLVASWQNARASGRSVRVRDDGRAFVGEQGCREVRSPLGEFESSADTGAVATEGVSWMKRSTRFKVLWTVWMAGGGLATAAVVYAISGSFGWAVVGLLASGVVLNAVGQVVTQPIMAVTGTRQGQPGRPVAK